MIGVPVEAYTALWIEIRPWQASVVGLRSRLIQPCGLKYSFDNCFFPIYSRGLYSLVD